MENNLKHILEELETIQKSLRSQEKKGLDTSSLKVFIKNLKIYIKIIEAQENIYNKNISFEKKLDIIQTFLEDKKVFPRIGDVINFANQNLYLGFKDQKESRAVTIRRIIGRIQQNPLLKEDVVKAVSKIRNEYIHSIEPSQLTTKKQIEKMDSYSRWFEILRNL